MDAGRSASSVFLQEIKWAAESTGPRMLDVPVPLGATGGWYLARATKQQAETKQRECKTTWHRRGGKLIAFSYSFPLHALLAFPCIHKALQLVVKLLQKFFLGGEVVWLPSAVTSIRCLKCIFFMSSNRIRSPSLRGEVIMPLCITYQSLFRNQSISFLCYLVLLCSALLSGLSFNYFASISILHSKHFTFLNMTLFICKFFTELCSVHRK